MSEVRTCEVCGQQDYASGGGITRSTVEYEADDGTIHAADWTLCVNCWRELVGGGPPPVCPFCLEPVMQDEDPADCPERPEREAVPDDADRAAARERRRRENLGVETRRDR